MEESTSIAQFIKAIKKLPEDERKDRRGIWYLSQKEHWIGWLRGYYGPGGYGRQNWHRDAKFVYNHIVNPQMLVYLAHAILLRQELIEAVDEADLTGTTLMARAGAIRKVVPWSEIYQALWLQQEQKETKSKWMSKLKEWFKNRSLLSEDDF